MHMVGQMGDGEVGREVRGAGAHRGPPPLASVTAKIHIEGHVG